MLTSLFSLFYVTGEFHRFLHRGRATFSSKGKWADGLTPPMNTIASRHQFKPIRIGKHFI